MTSQIDNTMLSQITACLNRTYKGAMNKLGGNTMVFAEHSAPSEPQRVTVSVNAQQVARIVDYGTHYEVAINLHGMDTQQVRNRLSAILTTFIPNCGGVRIFRDYTTVVMGNLSTVISNDNWYVVTSEGVAYP